MISVLWKKVISVLSIQLSDLDTFVHIFVLTNFFNINAIYIEIKLQVC